MNNKKGFTLTELIAVIVILALLIGLSTVVYTGVKGNILDRQLNNVISYIETKAEEYAAQTNIITVTVEDLIKNGYLTDDYGVNPKTGESINCHLINIEYRDGTYYAKYDPETNLVLGNGECASYEAESALKIVACEGSECDKKEWYNGNVTLKVRYQDGSAFNGSNAKYYWQGTDGFSSTNKEVTTNVSNKAYNQAVYKVVINYTDGEQAIMGTAIKTIKIDRQAPVITKISVADANVWKSEDKDVTIEYSDNNGAGVDRIYIGGSSCSEANPEDYVEASGSKYKTALDNGTYNICVMDKAGNVSEVTKQVTVTKVDKSMPSCEIIVTSGVAGENDWYKSDVNLKLVIDDHGGSGAEKWDITTSAQLALKNKSEISQTTETKGTTFYGYVVDKVGNITTCNKTIKVDKTAPTCTNSGDSITWINTDRTIKYGCSDSVSECNPLYSGGQNTYTTTMKTTTVAAYTIKDNAGNSTSCSARVANVYVDKKAPSCTNSGDSTAWTNATRTIYYGCSDTDSGCNTSYSGGTKQYTSGTTETDTIASYTIKDTAGNTTVCDARVANVYFDKTVPTCTTAKSNLNTVDGVNVTITCADDASGCDTTKSQSSATKVKATTTYTVYDKAGNAGTCTATVTAQNQKRTKVCQAYNSCSSSACGCASWGTCRTSACGCALDAQGPECGCKTANECAFEGCGCKTYNSCEHVACGCKTYNKCRDEACGCATYDTCEAAGCATYKECQTGCRDYNSGSECGCKTYNSCANSACGSNYSSGSYTAPSSCHTGCSGGTCEECSEWEGSTCINGIWRDCTYTPGKWLSYKTCRTSGCGCATYNSCPQAGCKTPVMGRADYCGCETYNSGSACGCKKYSSCRTEGCGCSTYNSCQMETCGCAQYETCPSVEKCGCKQYNACAAAGCAMYKSCTHSDCGCDRYYTCTDSSCGCKTWGNYSEWTNVTSCTATQNSSTGVECRILYS